MGEGLVVKSGVDCGGVRGGGKEEMEEEEEEKVAGDDRSLH